MATSRSVSINDKFAQVHLSEISLAATDFDFAMAACNLPLSSKVGNEMLC